MSRRFLSCVGLIVLLTGCAGYHNGPSTLKELFAFRQVVRQRFETTCGAASLATIVTHYFRQPTSEEEILHLINVLLRSKEDDYLVRYSREYY